MNRRTIISGILVFSVSITSCIKDKTYNENSLKNVNTSATLFEDGIALPCDTTIAIKLGDVIKPSGQIVCDDKGKYFVRSEGKIGSSEITFPEVKLHETQMFSGSSSISTGPLAGKTVKDVYQKLCTLNESTMITISGAFSSEIVDIKEAVITSNNKVIIRTDSKLCYLKKDFLIIFSKGLTMEMKEKADWYTVETDSNGRCVIRILKDVSTNPEISFNLAFTKIETQSGWVKDGKISIQAPVLLSGDVYAIGSGTIPSSFTMDYKANLTGNKVEKVTSKLNIKSETTGKTIIDIKFPEEMKKDAKVIFNNPEIIVSIKNGSRISMNASMAVSASKEGVQYGKTLELTIPGNTDPEYNFAINEQTCPGFTDMINFFPDKITISKVTLVSDAGTWVEIACSTTASITADYRTNIPLELKKGSYIKFNQEKKVDMSISGVEISYAEIAMSMTNNLPATLSGTLKIIIDGVQYDIKTDKELVMAPGSTIDLKAELNTGSPFKKIETLKLDAKASVTDDVASLNVNQSAVIRLKSFNFPKGITVQ